MENKPFARVEQSGYPGISKHLMIGDVEIDVAALVDRNEVAIRINAAHTQAVQEAVREAVEKEKNELEQWKQSARAEAIAGDEARNEKDKAVREALERAAKVAGSAGCICMLGKCDDIKDHSFDCPKAIADAIRALIPGEKSLE